MILQKHPQAEALIFDMDGTLTDSLPIHIATWEQVCDLYRFKFDAQMIAELTGRPTIDFAERVLAYNQSDVVSAEKLVELKQQYFWDNCHRVKPHQEVVDFMRRFHGKIPLAVGTGANRKSAELQLKNIGIYDCFDAIVSASEVQNHKPHPETFLRCAESMGVEPSKCEVLEDGELGMKAARSVGMFVIDVRPITYVAK
ncbi:MAG: beta-phosphoglucomutase family hydrolase [Bacteroidales bacterium]